MTGGYLLWKKIIFQKLKITKKIYGVCINIRDLDRAEEIIDYFKNARKEQIEAWKREWQQGEGVV